MPKASHLESLPSQSHIELSMRSHPNRSKNFRSRLAVLGVAFLTSGVASAVPVSYCFTGSVTEFAYQGSSFNPAAGQAISGELTYDSAYTGEFLGGPWPKASAVLDWKISVGDQQFHQVLVNPFSQFISSSGNQLSFSDEMPGSSLGDNFFDQGLLSFAFNQDFAGALPSELPITAFLSGAFSFGGGQGPGNYGARMRGTIDAISVPEPMTYLLMTVGLVIGGLSIRRRSSQP